MVSCNNYFIIKLFTSTSTMASNIFISLATPNQTFNNNDKRMRAPSLQLSDLNRTTSFGFAPHTSVQNNMTNFLNHNDPTSPRSSVRAGSKKSRNKLLKSVALPEQKNLQYVSNTKFKIKHQE